MICENIINKKLFYECLQNIFINPDEVEYLLYFLNDIKYYEIHEKMSFLLYNDFISYKDIIDKTKIIKNYVDDKEKDIKIKKLFNDFFINFKEIFEFPFNHIKSYFIRDFIIDLSYKKYIIQKFTNDELLTKKPYEISRNINEQLEIIYISLDDKEKELLNTLYIDKLGHPDTEKPLEKFEYKYLLPFIRINDKRDHWIRAEIEYTNVSEVSSFINANINEFKSIFKKISLGTIH